jgi:hypothetical protein
MEGMTAVAFASHERVLRSWACAKAPESTHCPMSRRSTGLREAKPGGRNLDIFSRRRRGDESSSRLLGSISFQLVSLFRIVI